jgi:hypothetical protein
MMHAEIREYIRSHDFVMLPGIGAFVAEYSRPYFSDSGDIIPGERSVRFNPLLRNDSDVSILKDFQEELGMSAEEVQDKYFSFLDHVNGQLATYSRYHWDNFGLLVQEGGELKFVPFTTAVTVVKNEVPEEESEVEELEEEGNKTMKYLIFALPLALLSAALVYMVFFKPSQREAVQVVAPLELEEEEVIIDTLSSDSTFEVDPLEVETYRVIIGIYKREKDAAKIVSFLESKGYRPKVRPHGPLYKVYLPSSSEEQARRYVKDVGKLIDDTPYYERI